MNAGLKWIRLPTPPAKALESGEKEEPRPMPVKTLPSHHADARGGRGRHRRDLRKPEEEGNFVIGSTREQDHPVCINLERFIQRSSGIFGATGTGKSFSPVSCWPG